jgi:uncharacterized membrane protein YjdF
MTENTYHTYSWKKPFFAAAVCLFALLFANQAAASLYLYQAYPLIDVPMHFLGGFSIGLASMGLLRMFYRSERFVRSPQFLYIMIMTISVGLVWEYVEYHYGVSVAFGGNFWFDTIKDLLMDTLGGILSYICFHLRKKNFQV